jgi:ssDNA-binding Zn-finger/Zn-ribbon topoisomerase 1
MTETTTPELSGIMDLHFSREFPEKNGKLVITIHNTGHFVDALNYARKHGIEQSFWDAFNRLLMVAMSMTLPRRAIAFGEGKERIEVPACPACEGKLDIMPDGQKTPSFFWKTTYNDEPDLVGGMIHHRHTRDWALHT